MKKIISLFQRNYDTDRLVRDEVTPGAEWVLAGEGVPTRKFDGTCCMVRDGKLYKRFDVKRGKTAPPDFEPAQDTDPITGHLPGWLPVGDGPEDKWHREAWQAQFPWLRDGTYELCGPKIQGNPEGFEIHTLIRHGNWIIDENPRTFEAIRDYLETAGIEGIVWWHPDGSMVKIKRRDFFGKKGE